MQPAPRFDTADAAVDVGAIVGGVVGGVGGLIILAALLWFFCIRRRRDRDAAFDEKTVSHLLD